MLSSDVLAVKPEFLAVLDAGEHSVPVIVT
jgi:hypothetical protein